MRRNPVDGAALLRHVQQRVFDRGMGGCASRCAGGVHDAGVTRRIDWKIQWCAKAPPG